jgi:glycosyltransferase involved in cell wall biosynthesis
MTELVTAVVPTHLRPTTLRQTLRSIAAQRGVDVEIIVVDDADDKRTHEVASAVPADRLKVIDNPGGTSAASSRNAGLAHASGRWVAFCDDDDLWAPDKLRLQLDELRRSNAIWSCTGAATVGPDLRAIGHERLDPLEERTMRDWNLVPGGGSSVMASADVLRDLGGFDESLSNMEDWELWIRLAERGPVASVDRPLVAYRLWPGSKSAGIDGMRRSAHSILERHGHWPPSPRVAYDLEWYVMWKLTNAGRRRDAALLASRLATRHHSAKCALRACALAVSPAAVRELDRRRRARGVPDEWRREIDHWLPALRAAVEAP